MKHAIEALEARTKQQGERLEVIAEMVQVVKSLKDTSEKQFVRIENVEGQVRRAKGTLRGFKWIGAIVGFVVVALTALEIFKYFAK